ncbi:hypothetical protein [Catenovulum sediminis]|uniref:SPOR domain-containing protein n=1 Tax=Catenovulum sediminis TaxID=1740262 RepID=A0ABV1RH27_9ALTE|nr:hypothetical protein [Catenovulum sediminis]
MLRFLFPLILILIAQNKSWADQNTLYIQAAACLKQKCVETYRQQIEGLGFNSQVKYTQQTKESFNIVSNPTKNIKAAQAYLTTINTDKRVRVSAKMHDIADLVYLDLGHQSNRKQAEWLVNFANYLANTNTLSFKIKQHITQVFSIKILAGPFKTVEEAQKALFQIRQHPSFSSAFITPQNDTNSRPAT